MGKTKRDLDCKIESRRYLLTVGIIKIIEISLWGFILLGVVYLVTDCLKSFAGKISIADLKFLGDLKVNKFVFEIILAFLSLSGVSYGVVERKMRKRYVKRYTDRIKELESQIDPKRTTSGLTQTGDQRKGE